MDVKYYLYHFARLHTAKLRGKSAPHKAVLLLAVMSLVEKGEVKSSEIELSDDLVSEFNRIWMDKLPSSCPFTCDICKPYFHMQHEPFWRLLEHEDEVNMVAEELGLYTEGQKSMPKSYSITAVREKFRCAKIDNDLYEIFRKADESKELKELLVSKYLTYDAPQDKKHRIVAMLGTVLWLVA